MCTQAAQKEATASVRAAADPKAPKSAKAAVGKAQSKVKAAGQKVDSARSKQKVSPIGYDEGKQKASLLQKAHSLRIAHTVSSRYDLGVLRPSSYPL